MWRLSTWPNGVVGTYCFNPARVHSHCSHVERAERERVERERVERERAERERVERERAERERAERERAERERAERERAEQELLHRRLRPVETGCHWGLRCMDGTRQSLLNQLMAWAANQSGWDDNSTSNTYWIYGLPGIGKTSLAHSVCASLHKGKHLAGAFFCRRDDPNLGDPKNILPTLIYKLAIIYPPFRSIVAEGFRNDPNLTPESMQHSLFIDFLRDLSGHPDHDLVFVIDALDECGDHQSRLGVMKALTNTGAQAPWFKFIITSRPEADTKRFFDAPTRPSYLRYDLATDQEATADLRTFARRQFDLVAATWYLSTAWPEESLFDKVISRAHGLFIFIKTLVLALQQCQDPEETLKATLQDSAVTGLEALYVLYSSILKVRIVQSHAEFRRVIGVLLITAPYRPLCEETVAELAGVKPNLVKKWVDDLSSLLYRDEGANGVIRIRHLSILDFFVSDDCPCDHRVSLQDANTHLGMICLRTMIDQLRFNICKLEDSRLANAAVQGLESRIKENISEALQYSSRYWSNHVCFTPDNDHLGVLGSLKEFFEGLYPLLWIEVLSIMGMVPIGAPSLRRVISWVNVSPLWVVVSLRSKATAMCCRMPIRPSSREFRMSIVSSSPSTPPSPSVLHTPIFHLHPSYPHSHPCRPSSAKHLLNSSRWKVASHCHGRCHH